jgi:hypothetical protein
VKIESYERLDDMSPSSAPPLGRAERPLDSYYHDGDVVLSITTADCLVWAGNGTELVEPI